MYGFRDYYIFITVRNESEVFFTLKTSNQRITRIDSPFRQTISIDISGFPRSIDKEILPFSDVMITYFPNHLYETIIYNCIIFNEQVHGWAPTLKETAMLIGDITVYNTNKQLFLYRSGYLWAQPSKHVASTYIASNLFHQCEFK